MRRESNRWERATDKEHAPFKLDLPEVKPINLKTGLLITGGLVIVGIGIGTAIATQIFFGAVTMVGLALLVESNKYIKYIVVRGNLLLDILIFGGSIYALASLGPTIAGGLTVAGVIYTGVYAPYVRRQHRKNRNQ